MNDICVKFLDNIDKRSTDDIFISSSCGCRLL